MLVHKMSVTSLLIDADENVIDLPDNGNNEVDHLGSHKKVQGCESTWPVLLCR